MFAKNGVKIKLLTVIIALWAVFLSLAAVVACASAARPEAYASAAEQEVYASAAEAVTAQTETLLEKPTSLADLQAATDDQLAYWADSLKRFDGREYDYITREDYQGGLGLCWAYAAVGAVEANILRDGVDPEVNRSTLNLDERVAGYARFNRDGECDPLYLTTNDTYGSDNWRSSGDFANNALMSMTQGFSLVDQVSSEAWKDAAYKQRLAPSKYFVREIKQIDHNEEAIKRAILEYGSVTMEYKAPESTTQTYLCHKASSAGHASLIIGWDDSISSSRFRPDKPSSDGAWIIKNSWGHGGDGGVNGTCGLYLSYEAYLTDNLYVVDMGLSEDYRNIYYYDGSISDDTMQYYADAYGAIYEAKLSTANEKEQLVAVSFGLRNSQSTVDIEIYKLNEANFANVNDEINKPDNGTLIGKKEQVYFEDDGFYTVDLDEPIDLEQGEIFSIVLKGEDSKGGHLNPYFAQDYTESVNDMTYRKFDSVWTSFKGYNGTYPGSTPGSCVRLRAITNIVKTQDAFDNDLQYARMELADKFVYYEKDTEQTPELMVYFGNRILKENEDYSVTYLSNVKPGRATVTITGLNGYYGEKSTTFEIAKPKYPPGMISGPIHVYSDAARLSRVPVPDGWKWNETQDIVLVNGDSGFGYQMKYTGDDGDCYQFITCSVKVFKNTFARPDKVDIADATVTIDGKYTYTGAQIVPRLRVVCKGRELKPDVDYTVAYKNNTDVGSATVTVTGQGGYSGTITKAFDIRKARWPSERPRSIIYVGKDVTNLSLVSLDCPGWTWRELLAITDDYFEATAIYSGEGANNYANTKMTIAVVRGETPKKNIASIEELRLEGDLFTYDGSETKPAVIARDGETILQAGSDFDVEYRDNIDAGQASAIVKGKNGYTGSKTLYFTIERATLVGFSVSQQGWTYGDSAPAPSVVGAYENAVVTYSYSTTENGTFVPERPVKAGTYIIKAEIAQSKNYKAAFATASFVIAKAARPNVLPPTEITVDRDARTLREVDLAADGWQWEAPLTELTEETTKAWAVYSDTENYETFRVEITVTKTPPPEPPIDPDPSQPETPDPTDPEQPDPGNPEQPDPSQPETPDPDPETPDPTDPSEPETPDPTDPTDPEQNRPDPNPNDAPSSSDQSALENQTPTRTIVAVVVVSAVLLISAAAFAVFTFKRKKP